MNKSLIVAIILAAIIIIVTFISASNIGFKMTRQTVASIPKSAITLYQSEGQPYPGPGRGVAVQTITATNSVIPRRLPLGPARACLYDSATGQGADTSATYNYPATVPQREFEIPPGEVIDMGLGETKTVTLSVQPYVVWMPRDPNVPKPQPQNFDTLYLFVSEKEEDYFYPQCYNLPEEQKARAIKIPLV